MCGTQCLSLTHRYTDVLYLLNIASLPRRQDIPWPPLSLVLGLGAKNSVQSTPWEQVDTREMLIELQAVKEGYHHSHMMRLTS